MNIYHYSGTTPLTQPLRCLSSVTWKRRNKSTFSTLCNKFISFEIAWKVGSTSSWVRFLRQGPPACSQNGWKSTLDRRTRLILSRWGHRQVWRCFTNALFIEENCLQICFFLSKTKDTPTSFWHLLSNQPRDLKEKKSKCVRSVNKIGCRFAGKN